MWFYNWLTGNMGNEGEFSYTAIHLIPTAIVFSLAVIWYLLGSSKKLGTETKRSILSATAIFFIIFELGWRILYLTVKGEELVSCWPMYPCNLGGVLLPVIALIGNKRLKQMFYLFGIVGALLTFAMPQGIFNNDIFVFPILKSVLQHTGLILIPVFEYASGSYRPSIKDFPWLFAGCLIHVLNAEGIDRLLGFDVEKNDYIFFRSGLPFVIPGVPGCITLSVFALIVFFALEYLLGMRESNAVFRRIFSKKQ